MPVLTQYALRGYRQLENAPSAGKQIAIDPTALFKAGKLLFRFTFIAVNLPAPAAAAIFALVFNKSLHIVEGVAEKQTDLVRKFHVRRYPSAEKRQTIAEKICFIAVL